MVLDITEYSHTYVASQTSPTYFKTFPEYYRVGNTESSGYPVMACSVTLTTCRSLPHKLHSVVIHCLFANCWSHNLHTIAGGIGLVPYKLIYNMCTHVSYCNYIRYIHINAGNITYSKRQIRYIINPLQAPYEVAIC